MKYKVMLINYPTMGSRYNIDWNWTDINAVYYNAEDRDSIKVKEQYQYIVEEEDNEDNTI